MNGQTERWINSMVHQYIPPKIQSFRGVELYVIIKGAASQTTSAGFFLLLFLLFFSLSTF